MTKLKLAQKIAQYAHKNQIDLAGKPYYHHCETVANMCKTRTQKIVAYLHDVLEDSDITPELLLIFGFSQKIVDAVVCMTRLEQENYEEYIQRIKQNTLATKVKLCDLTHNSDLTRLPVIKEHDVKRGVKYLMCIKYLKGIDKELNLLPF